MTVQVPLLRQRPSDINGLCVACDVSYINGSPEPPPFAAANQYTPATNTQYASTSRRLVPGPSPPNSSRVHIQSGNSSSGGRSDAYQVDRASPTALSTPVGESKTSDANGCCHHSLRTIRVLHFVEICVTKAISLPTGHRFESLLNVIGWLSDPRDM